MKYLSQIQVTAIVGFGHQNRIDRAIGTKAQHPSLLAGLVFDQSGERLTPTHAVKKGTRYRYYVSKALITGAANDSSHGRRIPAGDLEGLVIGRLRTFLADEGAILSAMSEVAKNGTEQQRLIARGRHASEEFATLSPASIRSILMALVHRIDITGEHVAIRVYRNGLHNLLAPQSIEPILAAPTPRNHDGDVLRLTVEARQQRVGREMKLLVDSAGNQAEADPGLVRIITRARDFHGRLIRTPI